MRIPRTARDGFTLLEVMLVIAVLVILTAITVPSIERWYGDVKLDAAADQIRARWADARARAMEEARAYQFAIAPGTGRFRLAPERADFWAGGGTDVGAGFEEQAPLVLEETLPEPIQFAVGDFPVSGGGMSGGTTTTTMGATAPVGDWYPVATFLPDGTCREDVEVRLEMEGQLPIILRLRGLTGSVTAFRPGPGEVAP